MLFCLQSLANILTPVQMTLYQPGCLLQKVLTVKAQEISTLLHTKKEPTQQWSPLIGVQKLVSQDFPTMHMSP